MYEKVTFGLMITYRLKPNVTEDREYHRNAV